MALSSAIPNQHGKKIHGKVTFQNEFGAGSRAVFIDIEGKYNKDKKEFYENKAKEVVKFFKEKWRLKEPGLIITVTGGAGVFKDQLSKYRHS